MILSVIQTRHARSRQKYYVEAGTSTSEKGPKETALLDQYEHMSFDKTEIFSSIQNNILSLMQTEDPWSDQQYYWRSKQYLRGDGTASDFIRRALAQGVSDHLLFVFIATFVTSVKQLLHF